MKTLLIAATAAVALPVLVPAPAMARPNEVRDERRECERELRRADSRREYERELAECRREIAQAQREQRFDRRDYRRERRHTARDWRTNRSYDWNRYEPGYGGYHADNYYRDGSYYADRRLSYDDRIYRGQDGRYYCRRDDGTTGLIIGAGVGAVLGNQINLGGSQTVRTIIGGAAGALIGREIDRGGMRCD